MAKVAFGKRTLMNKCFQEKKCTRQFFGRKREKFTPEEEKFMHCKDCKFRYFYLHFIASKMANVFLICQETNTDLFP